MAAMLFKIETAVRSGYTSATSSLQIKRHPSLQIKATGLHVNPKYHHLGASPNGLLTCTCCGDGLLDIDTIQHSIQLERIST